MGEIRESRTQCLVHMAWNDRSSKTVLARNRQQSLNINKFFQASADIKLVLQESRPQHVCPNAPAVCVEDDFEAQPPNMKVSA